jgi:hypothetical protein
MCTPQVHTEIKAPGVAESLCAANNVCIVPGECAPTPILLWVRDLSIRRELNAG